MNRKSTLSEIRSIPFDKIKTPKNIPVAVFIQEAENLYHVCVDDIEMLTVSGLDINLIHDIPARIEALIEAEAVWTTIRRGSSETETEWKTRSARGFELRAELVHTFRFAYSDSPHVKKQIKNMNSKRSIPALIQQLSELALTGKDEPDPLKKAGFDLSLLDEAEAMSDYLSELYGKVISERAKQRDYLKTRNQAYTYLKEAVDLVRKHGRFVFRKDRNKLRDYSSEYIRKQNQNRNTESKTADTDP